jgi:hypothetical protein
VSGFILLILEDMSRFCFLWSFHFGEIDFLGAGIASELGCQSRSIIQKCPAFPAAKMAATSLH